MGKLSVLAPTGTGSSPISPCADRGVTSSTWLLEYGQESGVERWGRRQRDARELASSPRPAGLTRASASPSGMLDDGRDVEVMREGKREEGRRGRKGRGGEGSGYRAMWERHGARTGAGCRRASQAHMRMHLPLMRSVLFCLLERLPSMLRLMFRRVSSVSSSWKSSLTL